MGPMPNMYINGWSIVHNVVRCLFHAKEPSVTAKTPAGDFQYMEASLTEEMLVSG